MAHASTSALRAQPVPTTSKLGGREWFTSIGSPRYVVAPMVDQSELAWRILSRLHGATLAYTPMFHAALFGSPQHPRYFQESFDTSPGSLEGVAPFDRPLIVQFCANDKELWLEAASKVVGRCDAVDLNLGCPQGIARKGHYGAFLMDEWELVGNMISHVHQNLPIAVTAKLRIFPSFTKTLEYASHLYSSGAQLLSVHGRTRESKGQLAGLASWPKISHVTAALKASVPVYANGGLPSAEEIEACLAETGTDGVMSAEGNLYNPMIFSPLNAAAGREYLAVLPSSMQAALIACNDELVGTYDPSPAYAPSTFLAAQYLAIVRTLPSTETSPSAIKAHLFKLFRPIWAVGKHLDLREALGRAGGGRNLAFSERVQSYVDMVDLMRTRIAVDLAEGTLPVGSHRPLTHEEVQRLYNGVIPYSHAQPYLRIAKVAPEDVESATDAGKRVRDEAPSTAQDGQELKRAKLDRVDEKTDTRDESHPALPPNTSTLPCAGSTPATYCKNVPASKCPHARCQACCAVLTATPEGDACEVHDERARRQAEKQAARAASRVGKRAAKQGKKVGAAEGTTQEEEH